MMAQPTPETPASSNQGANDGAASEAPVAAMPVQTPTQTTIAAPQRVLWLVAALAVLALLMGLSLWQKLNGMQEVLARQSAEAQSKSMEANAMAKQAVLLAQETAARAAVIDSRLSEVALQRSQLDELIRTMTRSRDENLVVDIDAALRLAQQQAQLTGSVEPLLAALKSAEQRIVRASQPQLLALQRAIARDIDRVKAAAVSDTPTMLLRLDELVHLGDTLILANAVLPAPTSVRVDGLAAQKPGDWWDGAVQKVLVEMRNLVRVSRIESPQAALLSPEQSFFLRENLKLKLLNARLGLLARQIDSASADLSDAQNLLTTYFDPDARKTQSALQAIRQVKEQMRSLQIPRIDETLAALATAAAGR